MQKQNLKYTKNFPAWCEKKVGINNRSAAYFNEREIWMCVCGVNVGYEIDGKGRDFCRPVLVLKKNSRRTFVGIPMKHTGKDLKSYFQYKPNSFIVFEQVRIFDAKRLLYRKEKISDEAFLKIKGLFYDYLNN